MRIAIVGVTGLVGQTMIKVLNDCSLSIDEIIPVASEKSIGKVVVFRDKRYSVVGMQQAIMLQPDIALFSCGGATSLAWATEFAKAGITVIDNSSAWRMDASVPLIVPSVNGHAIKPKCRLIANPNCSTIQMVMALAPLHRSFGIQRLVISTYQSITGTGVKAIQQFKNERNGIAGEMVYPHPIDGNVIPHCDQFLDNGYTKEEMKLIFETRKIFENESMPITATAVRVPTTGGHSESINVTFKKSFTLAQIKNELQKATAVEVYDNPQTNKYPMPIISKDTDTVFVGRLRIDDSFPNTLNMWIVADNLRIGAATNAVWIAEYLVNNRLL